MKDYRKHYGQAIPALHGKAIAFVINSIKEISENTSPCFFVDGIGTITERDAALIDIIGEKNGITASINYDENIFCFKEGGCYCKDIPEGRKTDLIYINLEDASKRFEEVCKSVDKKSDYYKGAFVIVSSVKENSLTIEEYNKLGFKLLDAMWNNDDTLFVTTLRYEGEKIQNKRNNKKEAPLNSEENFNNDKSE